MGTQGFASGLPGFAFGPSGFLGCTMHIGICNANPSRAKTKCEWFRVAVEYRLNVMKQATAVFGNDNGAMVVYFSAFVLNCRSVHLQYLADDGTAGVCLGMVHPILLWYI